jgi:CHAT domain-containing protein
LLGEPMSEEERERIKEGLLSEDDFFGEFELVKEELIDDYLENRLAPAERDRFQRHFLTTADRRRSLKLAADLTTYPEPYPGEVTEPHNDARVFLIAGPLTPPGEEETKKKPEPGPPIQPAPAPPPQPSPPRFAWARAFFATPLRTAACVLVVAVIPISLWFALSRQSSPLDEGLLALNAAYRQQRPVEARVSGLAHAPLKDTRGGDETNVDPVARDRAQVMLHSAATNQPGPAANHALGKLYLLERKFDDAIRYLDKALKADPNNPRLHNDLGAAWLEKGEQELQRGATAQSAESLGQSLGHLDRALELDPALLEALFNRALVHTHLKLFRLAEDDWKLYLEKDATSAWATEARQRLKDLEAQTDKTTQNREQGFRSFLAARQAADEDEAWRLLSRSRDFTGNFIEGRLLDEYLAAVADGRDAEARESLRAAAYAADLDERRGGDQFAAALVNCYAAAPPDRRAALAEARRLMKSGHEQLRQDRTGQAIEAYAAAARLFEQYGDPGEALLVQYLAAQSRLLQGESRQSLAEFEAVRQAAERDHYLWLFGQTLNAIANVHIGLNNYSVALEHSQHSLAVLERVGDAVGVVKVNDQLGIEHLRVGNPRAALGFHSRALALGNEDALDPLPLWRSYFTAAPPFHALGLTDAAIDFTKEALRLAEATKSPVNLSRTYAHLGLMYGSRGSYDQAAAYIQSAFDNGRYVENERVRTNVQAYAALQFGHLYRQAGDYARAVEHYDEAIRLYEQLDSEAFSYVAHKGKFLSCVAARDQCPNVEQELETALRLFEQYRPKIIEARNRYSFFDTEQCVYDVAIDHAFTTKGDVRRAFDYSEKCRARALLDLSKADELPAEGWPAGAVRPDALAEPEELAGIQQHMPADAQLVQYAVIEDKLLIWFVSRTRFEAFQQPITAAALEAKVLAYLRLIRARAEGDDGERRRAAAELYELLVKPVAPLLERGKLVCVVPDKILNRLPYAALGAPTEGHYLIEDYALLVSPSATMFVRRSEAALKRAGPGPERLLSVGDPRFDAGDFPDYKYLPAAAAEAREIAALYDAPPALTGGDATKERVVRALAQADVVHLATHAIVDENSPLYSELLLAKGAGGGSDPAAGVLRTYEIYGLRLPRPRLVVLSACRTADGPYYGGEGMTGIWSPFVAHNVPLVVASLWAVDSGSTKELMVNFHRLRHRGGLATALALQQAQVQMLRGPNAAYRQPYHWAPFIAIGGYTTF